jgi:hypothetical protein
MKGYPHILFTHYFFILEDINHVKGIYLQDTKLQIISKIELRIIIAR